MQGVDCSGFVSQLYRNVFHIELPRTAHEQAEAGLTIEDDSLKLGDLLFFQTPRKRINHVAMYLSRGKFVHSARQGGVRLDSLSETYYEKRFAGAGRILDPDSTCLGNNGE